MSKSWDEIVAERKGITLEEQIAEREVQEKEWMQEKRIENIQYTITGIIIPSLIAVLLILIIIKIAKKDFTKINFPKIKKQEKELENVEIIDKTLPMRWFKALINFFIPLWLFTGTLNILSQTLSFFSAYNEYSGYPLLMLTDLITLTITTFIIVFLFIAWKELKKFTPSGYKYAIIFFILTILMPAITMLIYLPSYLAFDANYDYYNVFVTTFAALIICTPNIIYLYKRKGEFSEHKLRRDSLGK